MGWELRVILKRYSELVYTAGHWNPVLTQTRRAKRASSRGLKSSLSQSPRNMRQAQNNDLVTVTGSLMGFVECKNWPWTPQMNTIPCSSLVIKTQSFQYICRLVTILTSNKWLLDAFAPTSHTEGLECALPERTLPLQATTQTHNCTQPTTYTTAV